MYSFRVFRYEEDRHADMLWTLFIVLLLAWLICVIFLGTASIAIHLILLVAIGILIWRLLS